MSKQSNNSKVSVAEIILLFQTAPEHAFQQLVSSGHYFHTKQAKGFWSDYIKLDHEKLRKQFPDSLETYNQVVWLKLFYDLNEFYKTEKVKNIEALIALNPDEASLTKALFLCLEVGELSNHPSNFPKYSQESLEGVKLLLREVLPYLKKLAATPYSLELAQLSNNLIKIQVDNALLQEFLDAFVWADFEMIKRENSKGYVLSLPNGKSKIENLFVLNHLKTFIKRDFKRKESHPQISEEDHFKKIDPKLKTDKGIATVYITGGIISSQTDGTTFIQVEEDYFKDFNSDDPAKKGAASLKILLDSQEQNFHYQYRKALSQIYQPNDEINIHYLHVEIEAHTFVTLYELLCAMSCIIARADAYRYMSEFPNSGSIKAIKRNILGLINSQNPKLSEQEKENITNSEIINHFKMFDEHYSQRIFLFFTVENILGWFAKVEELKAKSTKELKAIINLFSSFDSPLPFNPIYKIGDDYLYSFTACGKFNFNQFLYDNYISDKLFNPNNKPLRDKPLIGVTQKSREIRFANSLKALFKTFTPFVESSLEYGDPKLNYDFGDLKGEFDVVVYFEKENIIFPIQVKLSNVSPRSEKRKKEWIANRIKGKGVQQVIKDVTLLQSKSGLKFITDKLQIKKRIIAPLIYPLIVADNFYADHHLFSYNENDDCVICVSYFELKHLLLNQKIHDKQADLLPLENSKAATQLIAAIETNSFWNFIYEFANNFQFSKALSAITEDWKIEMKV